VTENAASVRVVMEPEGDTNVIPVKSEAKPPVKGLYLIIAGAVLLALGVITLAGVAVYIRSTNNYTRNAQKQLRAQWDQKPFPVRKAASLTAGSLSERADTSGPGAPVARLIVPRLNLDAIVVQLANLDDRANLNRGPGHVPQTAYPGMPGNVFIVGHRTTYGAPFGRIDELRNGDEIILVTAEGRYTYTVYEQRIVEPDDLSVLGQEGEPRVTLMACHPRFSASKRILAIWRLTGENTR